MGTPEEILAKLASAPAVPSMDEIVMRGEVEREVRRELIRRAASAEVERMLGSARVTVRAEVIG